MDKGKYIIVETNCVNPILFPCTIEHGSFLEIFNRQCILSAGFFEVMAEPNEKDPNDISVAVWGKSTSLNLYSREDDARLIKNLLRQPMRF